MPRSIIRMTLLLLIFAQFSCNNKFGTKQTDRQLKEIYLHEFKMVYYKTLLRKGLNNHQGYNEAASIDNSHYGEPILTIEDHQLIDSITTLDNQNMVADSTQSIGKVAEGVAGKQVFNYSLAKYNSEWLDHLAKQRLKLFWKAELNFRKSLR